MNNFAGRPDALGLTALSAGILMASPWLAATWPAWPAAISVAIGAGVLTWNRSKGALSFKDEHSREGFILPSDEVPRKTFGEKGIGFGITSDHYKDMTVENNLLARHTAIIGQSGVGKTTLGEYMLWQQTAIYG